MSSLTGNPASGSRPDRVIRALYLLFAIALLGLLPLSAQTVATYDFENGSTDGWVSFYNASTPVSTNAAAYTGSYSLLTTTSATGTGGPSISLNSVLQPGATYTITGWIRLTSAQRTANANFTVARTDASLQRRHVLRHHRQIPGAGERHELDPDRRHLHAATTETRSSLCAIGGRFLRGGLLPG